jgi:hypothetical protein
MFCNFYYSFILPLSSLGLALVAGCATEFICIAWILDSKQISYYENTVAGGEDCVKLKNKKNLFLKLEFYFLSINVASRDDTQNSYACWLTGFLHRWYL